MPSSLGWIDFSSEHRDRVKTVLDLLTTQGVIDELGIGGIRDAFSDVLFPGISTIQTRAKYFVIVPRIIKDYERLPDRQRRHVTMSEYLADQETQCRIRLVHRYGKNESPGIVGVSFGEREDREVQRQPSSIYWNGLRAFGIIKTDLSLGEFCRRHGGHRPSVRMLLEETREDRGDDADVDVSGLSPVTKLPEDEYWPDRLTITLSRAEGEFLRHHIAASQHNSLLGQIMMDDQILDEFLALRHDAPFDDLANLPSISRLTDHRLRGIIHTANLFWKLIEGAHVRYNYLLQCRFGEEALRRECSAKWFTWREDMEAFPWKEWDAQTMWETVDESGTQIRLHTRRFVSGWVELARQNHSDCSGFDNLVIGQECANKGTRARLRQGNLDEEVHAWIGIQTLTYRLPQAWRIVNDIHRGETGKADTSVGL